MDNVTHALAGCLLAGVAIAAREQKEGSSSPAFRVAATSIGLIAAELPDADLLYAGNALGMGKLGYLLHHRGYTHTVVFAIAGALLVWGVVLLVRPNLRQLELRNALLTVALAGTFSHLLLDFGNSYGVHPFWPFNDDWYYGDSIFIVEPWLWVAALPALFLFTNRRGARTVFGALLVIIVVAAWFVPMVGTASALALTVGSVVGVLALTRIKPGYRIPSAIVAWLAIDVVFGSASFIARREVRSAVAPQKYLAVALTPFVSNPLCFSAQIVQVDGKTLRITRAAVAPFPWIRDVSHCSDERGAIDAAAIVNARATSRAVAFGGTWSAPGAELRTLVAINCEIAAAMRFIRVPQWAFGERGAVTISDARFGEGGGGFAEIASHTPPASCPRFVPPWTPPRADLLGY
jgi:inner membrane protein